MEFPFKKVISAILIAGQISLLFTSISSYAQDNNPTMEDNYKDKDKDKDTSKNTFNNHVDRNAQQQNTLETAHSSAYSWVQQAQADINNTSVSGTITFGNERLRNSSSLLNDPLNANDLTPATSTKVNTVTNSDGTTSTVDKYHYYANGHAPELSQMQSVNKLDQSNIDTTSSSQVDRMNAELKAKNPSMETQAYSLIRQVTANRSEISPDDPMFTKSNEIIDRSSPQLVFSCDIDNDIATANATVHTEVLKECVNGDVGEKNSCTLRHFITPSILVPTNAMWNPDLIDEKTGKYPTEAQQKFADSLNVANYGTCNDYTSDDDRFVCHSIGFGRVSNSDEHLNTGNCAKGSFHTDVQLSHRDAIVKANLRILKFAGNVKAYIANTHGNLVDHSMLTCTPNTTNMGDPIDLTRDGYVNANLPGGDITRVLKELSDNSFTLILEYTGAIPYMTIEIVYDASKISNDEEWSDDSCAQTATNIHDGKLKGSVECYGYFNEQKSEIGFVDGTLGKNSQNVYVNGLTINKKYLTSLAGLPSNCALAKVTLDYSNYVDENGKPYSESNPLPACSTLKTVDANGSENPNVPCRQHSKKCALYSEDGECVLYKYLYDCGYDTKTEVQQAQEKTTCPPTACVGNDCINIKLSDSSADFSKALGLMNMAQEVVDDVNCVGGINSCVLFPGESQKCNMSYFNGGLGIFGNDCCEEDVQQTREYEVAQGVRQLASMWTTSGLGDSIRFANSDMVSLNFDPLGFKSIGSDLSTPNVGVPCGSAGGACSTNPKVDQTFVGQLGWTVISNFTGAGQQFKMYMNRVIGGVADKLNNICPYFGVVFQAVAEVVIEKLMAALMGWVIKMIVSSVFGVSVTSAAGIALKTALSSVLGEEGAAGAAQVAQTVGKVLIWVYVIYKIAQIITNIITACKEDDFKFKQKRDAHKCDFVTKWCSFKNYLHMKGPTSGECFQYSLLYCCFNSPLARIMNKQIRYAMRGFRMIYPFDIPAFAFQFGKKSADCSGIPMNVFANVDWRYVDLTEWLMLLQISGAVETGLDAMRNQLLPIGGIDNLGAVHTADQQADGSIGAQVDKDRQDLLNNTCFQYRNKETGQMETICPDPNEVDKKIDELLLDYINNGEKESGIYDNTENLIEATKPGPQGSGSQAGAYGEEGESSYGQVCETPDCYCDDDYTEFEPECVCLKEPTNPICVSYCESDTAEWKDIVCK